MRGVRIGNVPELYQAQSLKVDSTGSRIESEDLIGAAESRFAKPERQSARLGSHSTGNPAQQRSVEYPRLQPACANSTLVNVNHALHNDACLVHVTWNLPSLPWICSHAMRL